MLLSNKKIKLINNLIVSDFIYIKKNKNYKELKVYNSQIKILKSSNKLVVLDILEVFKQLKQLIRIFIFLKKNKINNINFLINNKQYQKLLLNFFNMYLKNEISINILNTLMLNSNNVNSFLIILNKNMHYEKNFFKNLILNNAFLVCLINLEKEIKNYGVYKIYNEISDFKKLIFLLVIISQIYKKN